MGPNSPMVVYVDPLGLHLEHVSSYLAVGEPACLPQGYFHSLSQRRAIVPRK